MNNRRDIALNKYLIRIKSDQSFTASITVEAAFIMPVIILTIFALIYLAFYLHDVCRIQNRVDGMLHSAGLSLKHETDIATGGIKYEEINDRGVYYLFTGDTAAEERKLQSELEHQLSKGLLLTKISEVTVEVGRFSLSVTVNTVCCVSLPIFHELFSPISKTILDGDYPIHNPAETIRRCEVILNTASDIKGVDQLKAKIENFFGTKD